MESNRNYSMSVNYEQGIGFSENSGNWPMPETRTGVIKIIDDLDYPHVLVLDYSDGKFYDVYDRVGAGGSGIVRNTKDKVSIDGTGGYNISPEVTFKEDTGESEKYISEILSNRFYVRPFKETNRDEDGYDSNGYLNGLEFSSYLYVDGNPTVESAYAKDISKTGEVLYDTKAEGHRLQTKFVANRTDFQLVGRNQEYITKDINYDIPNRITTEGEYQESISSPISWISRGNNVDLILGNELSIDGYVTGPDGMANSAINIGSPLTIPSIPSGNKHLIMFILGSATITIGGTPIVPSVHDVEGSWSLVNISGVSEYGNMIITPSGTCYVFDIRWYDETKSSDVLDYIFRDVTKNNGNNICPII